MGQYGVMVGQRGTEMTSRKTKDAHSLWQALRASHALGAACHSAKEGPRWRQDDAQIAPRWVNMAPRWRKANQDCVKMGQYGVMVGQRGTKMMSRKAKMDAHPPPAARRPSPAACPVYQEGPKDPMQRVRH